MPKGTDRRYTWEIRHEDPLMSAEMFSLVVELVRRWCATWPKKYRDGEVSGLGLGLIQAKVTIHAEDQWRGHRYAMMLARALAVSSRVSVRQVADPEPAKLEPHPFRGRRRWEGAVHQEKIDG